MNTKRILVVDDEPSVTRSLKLNLENTMRYEVRIENDSSRVVAAAREFHPDLILLDVVMPGLDGCDVSARIHADPDCATRRLCSSPRWRRTRTPVARQ